MLIILNYVIDRIFALKIITFIVMKWMKIVLIVVGNFIECFCKGWIDN